ncbi:MAG: hypothetical protein FJ399_19670 [Verrucomicrobia bacterium]|nr:hypothetical protein [Verrucomicrobiota bacterium]
MIPFRNNLELRMFLHQETGLAVQVGDKAVDPRILIWIPRSLIGYARKDYPRFRGQADSSTPAGVPGYVFTLPEWKVDQAGLWDFVTN